MSQAEPTACVIVIGNEILSGRIRDANIQFLALRLNEAGIRFREARVVADDEDAIVAAVNACRAAYTYVFTTGGIGPTHDDITSATIAKAFGRRLIRHPQAQAILEAYYPPEKRNEARMRMALLPEGAELIANPVSKAPGFRIDNVFVLAGVPGIVVAMWDDIGHRLKGGAPLFSRGVSAHLAEGDLAAGLAEIQARYEDVAIGSYPFLRLGRLGVNIVLRGPDSARLDAALAEVEALMRGLGGDPVADLEA